jgi:hypothetical protein
MVKGEREENEGSWGEKKGEEGEEEGEKEEEEGEEEKADVGNRDKIDSRKHNYTLLSAHPCPLPALHLLQHTQRGMNRQLADIPHHLEKRGEGGGREEKGEGIALWGRRGSARE